ncbi:DUF2303 family protein [Salinicola corii]|uniref:DUF2303 family protein n=1 Tax=Salinicola corii TaxID=2606937 RepID=A0A640W9U5_9GAMM|nr:DUF2303 family protein [Salinicola corii]KAA0017132.1 DUF2303 family protein [Salinicola corii]
MFDADALDKLQDLTQAANIGHPGTHVPTMLVPRGYDLVSLEKYMENPGRFRGNFATSSIEDYAAYVNAEDKSRVFVDIDSMRAKGFFDLGTHLDPGHADHTATLALDKTAPFAALLNADGTAYGQKDLAAWIEDWNGNIEGEDSTGDSMSPNQLAAAVRRIEIKASSESAHEDNDWSASRSGLDRLDANTGARTPAIIRFSCIPYEGLSLRTFALRVSIIADDQKPKLKLRLIGLEAVKEEIAQEFKRVLASHLGANATLLLGNFNKG